jgi:hypothetical protein
MEGMRPQSGLWDLAAGIWAVGAWLAALATLGWVLAPFENTESNMAAELSLLALATIGAVSAAATARARWRDDSRSAGLLFVLSLLSFAVWTVLLRG